MHYPPPVRFVIVAATPSVLPNDVNVFDKEKNLEINIRNQIAFEIAKKYKLPYVDHFNLVLQNKKLFKYKDYFHFDSHKENILLANMLCQVLILNKVITPNGDICNDNGQVK